MEGEREGEGEGREGKGEGREGEGREREGEREGEGEGREGEGEGEEEGRGGKGREREGEREGRRGRGKEQEGGREEEEEEEGTVREKFKYNLTFHLVANMSLAEIRRLYFNMKEKIFGKGRHNSEALEVILKETFGMRAMEDVKSPKLV